MRLSSSKKGVQLLVSQFKKLNIRHIVFSPGSRNAPLVLGFHQDTFFENIVIPDERSAAFVALGMAQQLGEPVALVCTSGSALLNYYPAIAEAFYQKIPLFVISADRPTSWIDQGDGQTIRQKDVFKNHVLFSGELKEDASNIEEIRYNLKEIAAAYFHCCGTEKGPVHLNFPLSEPLYETSELDEKIATLQPIQIAQTAQHTTASEDVVIETCWKSSSKIMILVGQHAPDIRLKTALKAINSLPNVAVMVENTSNMIDRDFIHCIDRTLDGISEEKRPDFKPDLLISIGDAIVSKKIKKFFRNHPPKQHWRVNSFLPMMDTYQCLTKNIPVKTSYFIEKLANFPIEVSSNYGAQWKQIDFLQQEKAENAIRQLSTYCDLTVYDFLLDCIPDDSILHLGNSSVVRYSQLFNPVFTIHYFCNRGTSGIDGSVSTAVGASWIKKDKLNVLIVGDLSFFYDSNGLFNQLSLPNLRIFVINNGGGDIFNIIPGPGSTDKLIDQFVVPHAFSAKGICDTFRINYCSASNLNEIESQIGDFFLDDGIGIKLMEIFTDKSINSTELHRFLKI